MNKKYVNLHEDDSLSKYFKDIKNGDLLTADEEIELATRIQNGDEKAVEKLVTSNLKFVITIAKEYQGQGLMLSDLINEGNYGLIKAAKRFDPTRGFRFISYAVYWIKQSIILGLNDNSRSIRLPANIINKLYKIRKDLERFEAKYGYDDISDDNKEHMEVMSIIPKCSSLNTMINDEGDELVNLIPNENAKESDSLIDDDSKINSELYKIIDGLDDREKDIIECYYGIRRTTEPMTLEAIGDKYSLSKERIRQINEKTIRKLRANISDIQELIF